MTKMTSSGWKKRDRGSGAMGEWTRGSGKNRIGSEEIDEGGKKCQEELVIKKGDASGIKEINLTEEE